MAKNNFDLLRLLLAGIVVLVHTTEYSTFKQIGALTDKLSSTIAVRGFFVVSGFLIFMSFERSSSLSGYLSKRVRRIFPACFTVVMLCAFGLVFMSTKPVSEYFSLGWLKYVVANLAFLNFLQPNLPGVFTANPVSFVNGPLWTLKIEVMFYLCVPAFVFLFRRSARLPWLVFLYCSSVAFAWTMAYLAMRTGRGLFWELGRQLPGQLSYFIAGGFFYYYLPLFERRLTLFLAVAIPILAINQYHPLPLLEPFALATIVVFFGLYGYMGKFAKRGDISYGVYILHCPIIQIFLALGWFRNSPWALLLAVVASTTACAFGLWHLVEKRFLFRTSHYIAPAA